MELRGNEKNVNVDSLLLFCRRAWHQKFFLYKVASKLHTELGGSMLELVQEYNRDLFFLCVCVKKNTENITKKLLDQVTS
jgi:hypothetical protein